MFTLTTQPLDFRCCAHDVTRHTVRQRSEKRVAMGWRYLENKYTYTQTNIYTRGHTQALTMEHASVHAHAHTHLHIKVRAGPSQS